MKMMMYSALVALMAVAAGCQTRITAEKFPEQMIPLQEVVTVDGLQTVITKDYARASGGWCVTARSPLWAKEQIKGLDVGAKSDGDVWLKTDSYDRDLSTNAVSMTREMFTGSKDLIATIAAAYATIAGGGAQADSVASLAVKAYNLFTSKGGDESKATVTSSGNAVTVSDGTTSVKCENGNCEYCADGSCTPVE